MRRALLLALLLATAGCVSFSTGTPTPAPEPAETPTPTATTTPEPPGLEVLERYETERGVYVVFHDPERGVVCYSLTTSYRGGDNSAASASMSCLPASEVGGV